MTTKITEKNISNIANAGVNWQAVVVADGSTGLTAVAGRGYFINTTSGAQTVTLPTSPNVGDVIVLKDYARTWGTNNVTIASTLIDGGTGTATFSTSGQTVTLVRMDNTKGWSLVNEDTTTNLGPTFITATGGTITTSGDFKIHSFTGDGSFVVATAGNPTGSNTVDYLVVAGGAAGGRGSSAAGGGGGAGGLRFSASTYTAPPTSAPRAGSALPVSAQTYPITVGGGGAGSSSNAAKGNNGSNSVFSTITSAGGGGGGSRSPGVIAAGSGGSGGGGVGDGSATISGGAGNTPPTSPSQGNTGGSGFGPAGHPGGGGGGAGAVGGSVPDGSKGGDGGDGLQINIDTNSYYWAGGGGGAQWENYPVPQTGGNGGLGGGGGGHQPGTNGSGGTGGGSALNTGGPGGTNAGGTPNGGDGGTNTGGGGGGSNNDCGLAAGSGGKGVVIIRYKFQ